MKKAKILLSTALALCMGATAVIPAFASINTFTFTKIGDYNADNKVNVTDVTTLQLQLSGSDVVTGAAIEHTDFDGDGIFDVNDISEMQKMVVGAEYNCYQQMDSSYRNIYSIWRDYNYYYNYDNAGERIDFEILCDSRDYFISAQEVDYKDLGMNLITSKEQFCNIFKVESPEFDDEFFEENALCVWLYLADASNFCGVNDVKVDNNKLKVLCYTIDDFNKQGTEVCTNTIVKLKKSDIENINELLRYEQMLAQ